MRWSSRSARKPHDRRRELHPAEVAVRVERADHRRGAHGERRDARRRRHRLVQVDDVEPLARERLPDAEDRARAEDDVRQRCRSRARSPSGRSGSRRAAASPCRPCRGCSTRVNWPGGSLPMIVFTSWPSARSASAWSSACSTTPPQKDHEYGTTMPDLHRAPLSSARGAPPLPARPRDPPAGAAGPRRARRGAALRARRHGDRRPSRAAAARGARARGNGARGRVHDLQLPHLRDDGGRRARLRRRAAGAGGAARGAGALGLARDRRRARSSCCEALAGAAAARARRARAVGRLRARRTSGSAALGLPAALVALAGQGYLRGVSNLRRPLEIVVVANVANVVLEVLFVYGFHWGIAGSAAGTAIAQAGMGVAFVVELLRPHADSKRPSLREMRPMLRVGRQIFVRTAALLRVVSRRGVGVRADGRRAARRAPDRDPALLLPRARARRGRDRGPGDRRPDARRAATPTARTRRRCG